MPQTGACREGVEVKLGFIMIDKHKEPLNSLSQPPEPSTIQIRHYNSPFLKIHLKTALEEHFSGTKFVII